MSVGRLDGKVAIITGAARGQGEAQARRFVEEGARVVLSDVLDEAGEKVAAELGDSAIYHRLDVTSEDDWSRIVGAAVARFSKLDVLINNAGIIISSPLERMSLDDFRKVVEVNQVGVFLGMRAVIAAMREAGGGSIVNTSSNAGLEGVPGVMGYTASKWAVRGMTKSAAVELGRYGIRVNSVHPGGVDTPMLAQDDFDSIDSDTVFGSQPIPRIGTTEEIAHMMVFLASDESSYSTGSEFVADGGMTAGSSGRGLMD